MLLGRVIHLLHAAEEDTSSVWFLRIVTYSCCHTPFIVLYSYFHSVHDSPKFVTSCFPVTYLGLSLVLGVYTAVVPV
jgi:hypothetical protein